MILAKVFHLLLFIGIALADGATATTKTKHYIVYMGDLSNHDSESAMTANHELLAEVTGSSDIARKVAVSHYSKSFRGFSAVLTPKQAQQLKESDSVVSIFESRIHRVHTTRSWDFIGVTSMEQSKQHIAKQPKFDVVVGMMDSGIWPESKSFNDKGLGPVPKKFKGKCVTGQKFTLANCNRKIIGARFYSKGFEIDYGPLESFGLPFFRSARDADGHGTHTASTVAGSLVANTSLFGIARGNARGGAPSARLSIYKPVWFGGASDADILSAFDDAIHDGVDIISMSLSSTLPQPTYFEDSFLIGAFHAFQKGILVSTSAGNNGPTPSTVSNAAPWVLTVAASSLDRELISDIYLGNSKILKGYAINPLKMEKAHALIAGSDAAAVGVPKGNASFCQNNTLDPTLIKGKIVVCTSSEISDDTKSLIIKKAGGVGLIQQNSFEREYYSLFAIPTSMIGQVEEEELQAYMVIEKHPVAKIIPTRTVIKSKPAPHMAVFSSRGPNIITPDIIKPDITAPGTQIFAAWSPIATKDTFGKPQNYKFESGTSMSCPHGSGVAAILKSYHPSWSPAIIMSAIMTTATVLDNTGQPIRRLFDGLEATPFDYGSGQINPIAALDPGLVYDFDTDDVINFLCSYGASARQLKNLTVKQVNCKKALLTHSYNFNYPSIGVSNLKGRLSVSRTVTYIGKGPTIYNAGVIYPKGVKVTVTPSVLKFTKVGEKMSFKVNFIPLKSSNGNFMFGYLTWKNSIHSVRSPIAVKVLST